MQKNVGLFFNPASYCASSWYEGLTKQLKRKLDVLERRMLRFVFVKGPRYHVGINELKSLSWLSVPQRVKYFSLVHVFKIRSGLAPNYLSPLFVPNEMVHSHGTRGLICNYHISRNLAKAPTSFAFTAIKHWNSLPISFKRVQSTSLRTEVKSSYYSNMLFYLFQMYKRV